MLGGVPAQDFMHPRNDFADAYRPVEHGFAARQGFDRLCPRSHNDYGHAPRQVCKPGAGYYAIEYDSRRHSSSGNFSRGIIGGLHSQRLDARLAQFRAHRGSQFPVGGNDEDGRHPVRPV